MFTGLIESLGTLQTVTPKGSGATIEIGCSNTILDQLSIGDSISVSGICSTVTSKTDTSFFVDYLEETLTKTTLKHATQHQSVNLELCLTPTSRMGGHMVTGHVDGTGTISNIKTDGDWHILTIAYPTEFAAYLIPKGSIAMDGISLTVVDVTDTQFSCHIIPHTYQHTTLHTKQTNDTVNLEFDHYAKYVHKINKLTD